MLLTFESLFTLLVQKDSGDEERHEQLLKEITSLSSRGKKRLVGSEELCSVLWD